MSLKREKLKVKVFMTADKRPAPDGIDAVHFSEISLAFKNGIPSAFPEQLTKALAEKQWNHDPVPPPSDSHLADAMEIDVPKDVHPELFHDLVSMGFRENRVIRALRVTANKSTADAIDWLVAHEDDPSLDSSREDDLGGTGEQRRKIIKSGLGDILRQEEEKQKRTSQTLSEAFQDLASLMSKAEDMVKLADQFYSSASKDSKSEAEQSAEEQDAIGELINMGIMSPVTRESAGSLYHDQLSRQLADFLSQIVDKRGGMMTLPDVYCLYNRARSAAELVSPDDLIQAGKLFTKLHLPFKMRSFQSGVIVIQSAAHDEAAICQNIAQLVQTTGQGTALSVSLSAVDVVRELHVPLTIATEHLLLAERNEVLCRDEGPGGLRFYANFFRNI